VVIKFLIDLISNEIEKCLIKNAWIFVFIIYCEDVFDKGLCEFESREDKAEN
jgi:hypothetical protein